MRALVSQKRKFIRHCFSRFSRGACIIFLLSRCFPVKMINVSTEESGDICKIEITDFSGYRTINCFFLFKIYSSCVSDLKSNVIQNWTSGLIDENFRSIGLKCPDCGSDPKCMGGDRFINKDVVHILAWATFNNSIKQENNNNRVNLIDKCFKCWIVCLKFL